ncbi:uncharacterized protein LOC127494231 isoform X2 [Ctenopharyngodon idella]|uniref:uncharacterized protein LOC127494231 isoform X2 n=1 Tax=Ctenopharyngodon idella TaxID=7959 RepID=UPI0022305D17|nr:uncharacterized protein LOC127494231 isoform X2 [Ctenopharyngodon idella]
MLGRGIMRVFGETLLIIACLHLYGQGSGQSGTCTPENCLNCLNNTILYNCTNGDPKNCMIEDFNVTIEPSSTLPVDEGSDVTVTCIHNLTNGVISWLKNDELQKGENQKTFEIKIILKDTDISCNVESHCGVFNSTITITVKLANNMMIIMICVGGAAALLMLFAVGMKIKLRRGQAQNQARKRQRQQNMENIHSTVNTVTSYY